MLLSVQKGQWRHRPPRTSEPTPGQGPASNPTPSRNTARRFRGPPTGILTLSAGPMVAYVSEAPMRSIAHTAHCSLSFDPKVQPGCRCEVNLTSLKLSALNPCGAEVEVQVRSCSHPSDGYPDADIQIRIHVRVHCQLNLSTGGGAETPAETLLLHCTRKTGRRRERSPSQGPRSRHGRRRRVGRALRRGP